MVEELGIEKDRVVEMNQFLYRNYGTSMAGLKVKSLNFNFVLQILHKTHFKLVLMFPTFWLIV